MQKPVKSTSATSRDLLQQSSNYGFVGESAEPVPIPSRKRQRSTSPSNSSSTSSSSSKPPPPPNETEQERLLREHNEYVGSNEDAKAFGQRLKEKEDKSNAPVQNVDARDLLPEDASSRRTALDDLHKISRETYLVKREKLEITKLEKQIAAEEEMFSNEQLTKEEIQRHATNKELLRIAKERQRIMEDGEANADGFHFQGDANAKNNWNFRSFKKTKVAVQQQQLNNVPNYFKDIKQPVKVNIKQSSKSGRKHKQNWATAVAEVLPMSGLNMH